MLNALRKIHSRELTESIYHQGVWSAADNSQVSTALLSRSDEDMLHMQIGIAIGYGYVVGTVSVEGDRVRYSQLTLTSKGHDFLATMQSTSSLKEKPVFRTRAKWLTGLTVLVATLLLLIMALSLQV